MTHRKTLAVLCMAAFALAGGALLIKLSAFQLGLEVLHVDDLAGEQLDAR